MGNAIQPRDLTVEQVTAAMVSFRALKAQIEALEEEAERVIADVEINAYVLASGMNKLRRSGMMATATACVPAGGEELMAFSFRNSYDDDSASASFTAQQLADPLPVIEQSKTAERTAEMREAKQKLAEAQARVARLEGGA
jgi:hypothetical protein